MKRILGWPPMVFFRRTRNLVRIPKADRMIVDQLCKQHNVPSPLEPEPFDPRNVDDLEDLRTVGEELERDFPVTPELADELRAKFPEEVLIQLAESDRTPAPVLRAVTYLLGL